MRDRFKFNDTSTFALFSGYYKILNALFDPICYQENKKQNNYYQVEENNKPFFAVIIMTMMPVVHSSRGPPGTISLQPTPIPNYRGVIIPSQRYVNRHQPSETVLRQILLGYGQQSRHIEIFNRGLTVIANNSSLNYPNLETLYLPINQINRIEDGAFNGLSQITEVDLSHNSLTAVGRNTFSGLASLQSLFLKHNKIETIDEEAFSDMRNLTELWLGNNQIMNLQPGTFVGLSNLSNLELKGNMIQTLEYRLIEDLARPLTLDIRNNPLQCNWALCRLQWEIRYGTILIQRFNQYGSVPVEDLTPNCASAQGWNGPLKNVKFSEVDFRLVCFYWI